MLERQKEGIEAAKRAGKYKGRKAVEVDAEAFKKQYEAWKSGRISAKEAMKELKLKPNTFYRRVKAHEREDTHG